MNREGLLTEIRRLLDRGDANGALRACRELVDAHPHDWSSINLLGDLFVRSGDTAAASAQFRRAADHFRDEGFLSKAAALYRKVLKLQPDDHALAQLAEIAVAQGLLAEARQHLAELERRRRAGGDSAGADDCARRRAGLEARPRGAAGGEKTAAPSGPADVPVALEADTAEVGTAADDSGEADLAAAAPEAAREAFRPPDDAGTRRRQKGWAANPAAVPTPESVFERLRQSAADETAAEAERFARAQDQLERGEEAAAVADLEAAAGAPLLRFKAASQLGRLYLARGAHHEGVAWLERAATAPPPDAEEMAAVLYDLADGLEQMGAVERALPAFMKVEVTAPGYRDARARIARLLSGRQGSAE
jgi:tetratricopeptide (TPR) repeat protein